MTENTTASCGFEFPEEPGDNQGSPNLYRECSLRGLSFLYGALNHLLEAGDPRDLHSRLIAVSLAVSHPAVRGQSISQLAGTLGVTRQALSKSIVNFQRTANLPPMPGQKAIEA
jgi:hypothetical protein